MKQLMMSLVSDTATLGQKVERALRAHREFDKGQYRYDRGETSLAELKRLSNGVDYAERILGLAVKCMKDTCQQYETASAGRSKTAEQISAPVDLVS